MIGMATVARGWQGFRAFLEMIKIEHSIFALPFALIGMLWGNLQYGRDHIQIDQPLLASTWPNLKTVLLILIAMVSCRSAAMAYNRIADRDIDALNPRTKMRAIPAGILSLRTSNIYFFASCGIFFVAAFLLNPLAFALSPIALGVTIFYSISKRFTPLCHFILGLSLGIAPAAAWIAVSGRLDPMTLWIVLAVALWTAGFDIIYSLQDENFDRENSLRSLPQTVGANNALHISRICHFISVLSLSIASFQFGGVFAWIGVFCVALVLIYEQSLVKPNDLSKVNVAFFTLNGFVSIGFFAFVLIDLLVRSK